MNERRLQLEFGLVFFLAVSAFRILTNKCSECGPRPRYYMQLFSYHFIGNHSFILSRNAFKLIRLNVRFAGRLGCEYMIGCTY